MLTYTNFSLRGTNRGEITTRTKTKVEIRATAYLEECKHEFKQVDLHWTGSTSVDALILAKSLTMQKQGITFRYSSYPLQQMPIKESAFCTIFSFKYHHSG